MTKANLYTLIRLESLVMPQFYDSNLSAKELLSSRDMCLSPALLDFLEQSLEPFDLVRGSPAAAAAAASVAAPLYSPFKHGPDRDRQALFAADSKSSAAAQRVDARELPKSADAAVYFPVEVSFYKSLFKIE